ncbi:MAG: 50S ribosomal protein L6, partial [Bacteroidota bacterium]|nr:50S ribosomal protein L6 [Bacteroidota bacterium]
NVPEGVEINISKDNLVTVKGKLGQLEQKVDSDITVKLVENQVVVERHSEQKNYKSLHGLYRALIQNMVIGVSEGYKIELELIGVGYKADVKGQVIELSLGYSHHIFLQVPAIIKVEAINERGKTPTIIVSSIDKQLVGQVAAKIRSFRVPEPYKGKGIKYKGEIIRRKAGKSAATA